MPVSIGDLGQGLVQDRDVVGGGVCAGVAWPQQTGQRLAGVVQKTQQRVAAEAAFVASGQNGCARCEFGDPRKSLLPHMSVRDDGILFRSVRRGGRR